MRVLVACEFSGIVREAFRKRGHDAWSLDKIPAEDSSPNHIQIDLSISILQKEALQLNYYGYWDLLLAFPPCTDLAVSGARWFKQKQIDGRQQYAISFARMFESSRIDRVATENPIGILSTQWRKPEQIIQPWMFGHGETKATCLWLKNLPPLKPTNIVNGRIPRVHHEPPSPDRWKNRSRTYQGIADAMAEQWGRL